LGSGACGGGCLTQARTLKHMALTSSGWYLENISAIKNPFAKSRLTLRTCTDSPSDCSHFHVSRGRAAISSRAQPKTSRSRGSRCETPLNIQSGHEVITLSPFPSCHFPHHASAPWGWPTGLKSQTGYKYSVGRVDGARERIAMMTADGGCKCCVTQSREVPWGVN